MLKGKAKRSLAFVLAACMLLALLPSFGAGASAASVSYTEVDPSVIDAGAAVLPEAEQDAEQDVPAADEEVHVIILFEQKSLAKKGFSTKDLLENEKAASYSSSLKKAAAVSGRPHRARGARRGGAGDPFTVHRSAQRRCNGGALWQDRADPCRGRRGGCLPGGTLRA